MSLKFNFSNLLLIISSVLFSACGQNPNSSISYSINSLYLDLKYQVSDQSFNLSKEFFTEDTTNFNEREGKDILFQPNARETTFTYGDLSSNVLGLTSCMYSSDNTSSCSIVISNKINPDKAVDDQDKEVRRNSFMGVLRHELGHAFGLGHITDNPNHVMYPYFKNEQLQETNVVKFIEDLNNFRSNGPNSGLPTIDTK